MPEKHLIICNLIAQTTQDHFDFNRSVFFSSYRSEGQLLALIVSVLMKIQISFQEHS